MLFFCFFCALLVGVWCVYSYCNLCCGGVLLFSLLRMCFVVFGGSVGLCISAFAVWGFGIWLFPVVVGCLVRCLALGFGLIGCFLAVFLWCGFGFWVYCVVYLFGVGLWPGLCCFFVGCLCYLGWWVWVVVGLICLGFRVSVVFVRLFVCICSLCIYSFCICGCYVLFLDVFFFFVCISLVFMSGSLVSLSVVCVVCCQRAGGLCLLFASCLLLFSFL